MITLWDAKTRYEESRSRYRRDCSLCVSLSVLVLTGVVVGIILSGEDYLLLKWSLISLATLMIWFCLYFLDSKVKGLRSAQRFYSLAISGMRESCIVTVVGYSLEEASKDGLDATILKTQFKENGHTYERDFYVIDSSLNLMPGQLIKALSYSNVLMGYEVLS